MTAVLFGILFIIVGVWGLLLCFHDFLTVLRGLGPLSIFLAGLISLIVGISSFQSREVDDDSKP